MESALLKFVNIDGDHGKKVMPQPHDEFHNPEAETGSNKSRMISLPTSAQHY
jgi:hypothetical protein